MFSYRKIVKTRDYDACDVDSYVLYGAFRYFDTDALINTLKEKGLEVNVK